MKTCRKGHQYSKKYKTCSICAKIRQRDWFKAHPEYEKGHRLKRYWQGSTWQEALANYNQMFIEQEGKCKVCTRHQSEFKIALAVDHDHKCCPGKKSCGKCVRGILCDDCNHAEAILRTPEVARRLADYMEAQAQPELPPP